MGLAEIKSVDNVYWETNPLVSNMFMHTRRREHFGAVMPCSILDSCYTNIKMKSIQLIWLNIVGLYNFHTIVVTEYVFYAGSLKGWIERPAKTTCTHAALWLAGFIVCQCWSSSVKLGQSIWIFQPPTPFHPFTLLQKHCTEDMTAETHTWE